MALQTGPIPVVPAPQYGEIATPEAQAEARIKNVIEPPTNEYDVEVERLRYRRSVVRMIGTVLVFAVLITPVTAAVIGTTQ